MKNITPWLDYFEMLRTYTRNGFIEVWPQKQEAYITEPALATLAGHAADKGAMAKEILEVALRLRTFSEYINTAKEAYKQHVRDLEVAEDMTATAKTLNQASDNLRRLHARHNTFALHVVEPSAPHDLRYSVLVTRKRRWFWPWSKTDIYDAITYR